VEESYTHKHQYEDHDESVDLAVKVTKGSDNAAPGFVWLGGFRSDMAGTKAETMVDEGTALGCSTLRFDYSGHGSSGGAFVDGSISRWVCETLDVVRSYTRGAQIFVGSSMGGWIALRLTQELARLGESDRLGGLLLIAPAPDFTQELMEPGFTEAQRAELETQGFFKQPSEYSDEPNIITKTLIEDGRNNLVFNTGLNPRCRVHILQGMDDPDVPHTHAMRLVSELAHDDVSITLIKNGDHRLSTDSDLALLRRTMRQMVQH